MAPRASATDQIIRRAGTLAIDEAADLYRAYAARVLIDGWVSERRALTDARRTAARTGRLGEYEAARRAAVTAWRHVLPREQGPWLLVGRAIANAAGAVHLEDILDDDTYGLLVGPWRQAVGFLTPVGPGPAAIPPPARRLAGASSGATAGVTRRGSP